MAIQRIHRTTLERTRGDTWNIFVSVENHDITGATFASQSRTEPDATPVFNWNVSVDGQVVKCTLPAATTETMNEPRYEWDLQMTSGSEVLTIASATILVKKDITVL